MAKSRFREVHGLLLLDKPLGLSSNQALQKVRHLFMAAKAGHTGSLDPLATGVLPICLGEATKFSQYLLEADKAYRTRAVLGVRTDSGDAEGRVIETRPVPPLDGGMLEEVLARFRGDIEQVPPMYSALKVQGQPLYKLARKGQEVERAPRQVRIFSLELLEWGEDFLDLRVHCSKGTYIRTLVEDIGEALGCGAHVAQLRRERTAGFDLAQAHSLEALQALAQRAPEQGWAELDALLLPVDAGLEAFPEILLEPEQSHSLLHGQMVRIPPNFKPGLVRLRDASGLFIGLGEVQGSRLKPHRLVRAETLSRIG